MKRLCIILTILMVFACITPAFADVPGVDKTMEGSTKGIVAVSHPLAAEAGKKILENGGNAVDAAAGIQLALNVVEPMMSGIGGGGFMMIYLKDENKTIVIDSREMAPKNVDNKLFLDENGKPIPWFERHTHGSAVGVPGTLKGVETSLEKYGTKKLSEVIDYAIKYAEDGVNVNWPTARYIENNIEKLNQYETAAKVFIPNGTPLKVGDRLIQPDLAKTLKLIKEKGSEVFYNGEIGEALVKEVTSCGGTMTMDDLRSYQVKEREPVRGTYRGYEIVSMSPPSSGGLTIIEILKIMEGYDVKSMGLNSTEYLHHLIEAMHLAYADRGAYMADEDFYPVPKKGLVNEKFIKERRSLINPYTATQQIEPGDPWKYEDENKFDASKEKQKENPIGQTTHFSVIDKNGNMVAYTTTIEQVFGTGIMVPEYGFMLNNEMTDFDAKPGGVNEVEPYKRPRSSMSPTLVMKDGKPFMAVGSPGGPTIITSVLQTIMNVIDHNLPIQEAILSPRIYSSSYPNVRWEAGINQDVILELMSMGHVFEPQSTDIGCVQAALYDYENNKMYGGADNTREGTVLGVDNVTFTVNQPKEIASPSKGLFNLEINDIIFPYYKSQKILENGTSYILSHKLLLGLGLGKEMPEEFKQYMKDFDGKSYLPIRAIAERLGYNVSWDSNTNTVILNRNSAENVELDDYKIKEDKVRITN